jgi:hypothetical protein
MPWATLACNSRGGDTEGKSDVIDKTQGYSFLFCLQQVLHEQLLSHSCDLVQKYNFAVAKAKSREKMVTSNMFVKLLLHYLMPNL